MRAPMLLVLVSGLAVAGGRGATREALAAIDEVQDLADGSDASCARSLKRKADELEDLVSGASARRAMSKARDLREWVDGECPRRLAEKTRQKLEVVIDALRDLDDGDDRRSHRRSDDDDDDDRPRSKPRAVARDCGFGADDPGCGLARGGVLPMDREAWTGFIAALRSNPNELTRLDSVKSVVATQALTARQLGAILDTFQNELLKLDAAKAAAPRVVNPQHALGHASKFRNSLLAADYTRLFGGG